MDIGFKNIFNEICICFDFINAQKCEKKPLVANKKFVFVFNWKLLLKKFVDSYSKNSWKHVMNLLIDVLCNQDDSTGEEKEKSPKLHYLGPFVSNLSQLSGVREKLLADSCKLMSRLLPFTEYLTSSGEKHL